MKLLFLLSTLILSLTVPHVHGQTKPYVDCYHIQETITIDGNLTEPCWNRATPIRFHVPVSWADPLTTTTGRICWDDKYLYVSYDAKDQDLKGTQTERDSSVYLDDVLEVFFQPGAYDDGYHNVEINILGTIYDGYNGKSNWTCEGLLSARQLDGTPNNSTDLDRGWRMEVAVPFSSMIGLGKARPAPGDVWPFHLARYDRSVYLPGEKQLSSSAFLTQAKFHNREDWMEIHFRSTTISPDSTLVIH